jgi:hypothetical protein
VSVATAKQFRAMTARLVRHFGDGFTVTIRRRHTLKSQRKGTPTISGTLLVVNGAFSTGASAIGLRADLLTGKLPKGCKFTIAGNATEYTVGGDVTASGGALAGVSISPVLAANVVDATAVTFTQPYVDYPSVPVLSGDATLDNLDTGERQTGRVLRVPATTSITPEPGDFVVEGSAEQRIADVRTINPGGGAVRYDLVLGT